MDATKPAAPCQTETFLSRIREALHDTLGIPEVRACLLAELEEALSNAGMRGQSMSKQRNARTRGAMGGTAGVGSAAVGSTKVKAVAARTKNGANRASGGAGRAKGGVAKAIDAGEQLVLALELESAVRARDEFLDVASHELRTPLTALQLQLQGLERQLASAPLGEHPDAARLASRLAAATRQAERLTELVAALFVASRANTELSTLRFSPVDLSGVALRACEKVRDDAARRGCVLTLDAPHPVHGHWDESRMSQVLSHLLANALKYAPGAPVTVTIRAEGEAAVLSVSDRGMGIPSGRLARIFDRYERAVPSNSYGGLGLGLFVVRSIVEAHGGRISVESREGEGACFLVRIPRNADAVRCDRCDDGRRDRKSPSRHGAPPRRSQAG